jgi:hypothetical protein
MDGELVRQPTVNCFADDTKVVQPAMFARTAHVYCPDERPLLLLVHDVAVAGEAEQIGVGDDVGLPIPAKTSYPVTPDAVDGVQLNVTGVFSFRLVPFGDCATGAPLVGQP